MAIVNHTAQFYLGVTMTTMSGMLLLVDIVNSQPGIYHIPRPIAMVVFSVLLLITRSLYKTHDFHRKRIANNCGIVPEYPHKDPWGLDWALKARRLFEESRFVDGMAQELEDVGNTHSFRLFLAGNYCLLTDEPENIRTISSDRFDDWDMPPTRKNPTVKFLGRHSIFGNDGPAWSHARATLRPAFVRNTVADLPVFDCHISRLIGRIGDEGKPVDLQQLLAMMTMDSSSDFMFGYSLNTLVDGNPDDMRFSRSFDLASLKVSQAVRNGPIATLLPDRERDEANEYTKRYVEKYINTAMENMDSQKRFDLGGKEKYVFLPELVKSGASPEMIRDQIMSLFLAGRDTNTGTMAYLFWQLARRPDIVEKIRAEIESDLGDTELTWETLRNLKYLNWTIKEALRLNPALPMNSRVAVRDTVLPVGGGADGKEPVFCPKGTVVRWVTWQTHRKPDIYGEDANEFRPERWESLRPTWEYTPFSGGPRICIGQQFALTQIALVTLRLLQHYKTIEARDEKPPELQLGITVLLKNGCWVSMRPA